MSTSSRMVRAMGSVLGLLAGYAASPSIAQTCNHPQGAVDVTLLGDLNDSGQRNVADAVCSILCSLADAAGDPIADVPCLGPQTVVADVSCDGEVDITDVIAVIYLSIGANLPAGLSPDGNGCPGACTACHDTGMKSCLIDGACVPEDERSGADLCRICLPDLDPAAWTVETPFTFYRDDDEDAFGQDGDTQQLCAGLAPYSTDTGGDCADANPAIKPGATDLCDYIDNDCNGQTDENDPTRDNPCDGTDSDLCEIGFLTCTGDGSGVECVNETIENIPEVCGGGDEDCDGIVDEGTNGCGGACTLSPALGGSCDSGADADLCDDGTYVCNGLNATQCNDAGPDLQEDCGTPLVDDDCDGLTNEGCANLAAVLARGSLQFDGVDDKVHVGNPASVNVSGTAITMEAWVRPSANGDHPVLAKEGGSNTQQYWFGTFSGKFGLLLGDGGGWALNARASGSVPTNQWTHIASTWDGSTWRNYQNGVEVGSGSYSSPIVASGNPLTIGVNSSFDNTRFVGHMVDVRLWNVARTAAQIRDESCTVSNQTGLVGRWMFNEGTGQVAAGVAEGGADGELGSSAGADGRDPSWSTASATCSIAALPNSLANLRAWYKADSLALSEGSAVSSWADDSGQNHNLTGVTGTPRVHRNVVNGMPVVRFDGASGLTTGSISLQDGSDDFTVFLVIRAGTSQNTYADVYDNTHAGNTAGPVMQQNVSNLNEYSVAWWNGAAYTSTSTFSVSSGAFEVHHTLKSGTTLLHHINGLQATDDTVSDNMAQPAVPLYIGHGAAGGRNWNGDMAEFIYFNRALSAGEIVSVTQYLNSKYITTAIDCMELRARGATASGIYTIDPDGPGGSAPFAVACDMTTDGGGWTLVGNYGSLAGYAMYDYSANGRLPSELVVSQSGLRTGGQGPTHYSQAAINALFLAGRTRGSTQGGQYLSVSGRATGGSVLTKHSQASLNEAYDAYRGIYHTSYMASNGFTALAAQFAPNSQPLPQAMAPWASVAVTGRTCADPPAGIGCYHYLPDDIVPGAGQWLFRENLDNTPFDSYSGSSAVPSLVYVRALASQALVAGRTCLHIKASGAGSADGVYWIDPDGAGGAAPFQADCDMTFDGGGWTLVARMTVAGGQAHYNVNAVGIGATDPVRYSATSTQKFSDARIAAIRAASPYSGTTAYRMTCWEYTGGFAFMYCSSSCVFDATASVINQAPANCALCTGTFEGTLVQLSPNDGTRGLGHHHDTTYPWSMAYQRHPEQGTNTGCRNDLKGGGSGHLWVR